MLRAANVAPFPLGAAFSSLAYAASVTLAPYSLNRIIGTGDITLHCAAGSAALDGALIGVWFTASGANRNITLDAAIVIPTTSTFTSPATVASTHKAVMVFQYDAVQNGGQWELHQFINGY